MEDVELFKIYLECDLKHFYTDSVTNKDKELMQEYIDCLSIEESEIFRQVFNDFRYHYKQKDITHNSIQLTLKLYKETGFKVFPCVNKIACKGFNLSGGTYAFSLYLLSEYKREIYSYWKLRDCLRKKYKLQIQNSLYLVGDIEITLEEIGNYVGDNMIIT